MNKTSLSELETHFSHNDYVLIIGLGFDLRCLTILRHFPMNKVNQVVGISNVGWSHFNESNITEFNQLAAEKSGVIIGNNAESVIEVADGLVEFINSLIALPEKRLVVDITSLSHELLVVLIGILDSFGVTHKTTILYIEASEYSFNTPDNAMWLSRGVKSIRSVLGFPGIMLPSKKLHLIILSGFEVERALEVILRYEPTSISIGLGDREQSISDNHHDKNKLFFDQLNVAVKEQYADALNIYKFTFSCVDPLLTKEQLLSHIDSLMDNRNIVVCPLNTKLSTVGVVFAAIECPKIQICYAEPEEYNMRGYSIPGKNVTIVQLDK